MTMLVQLEGLDGSPVLVDPSQVIYILPRKRIVHGNKMVAEAYTHVKLKTEITLRLKTSYEEVLKAFEEAGIQIRKVKSNG